jgi:hypothetical protein
MTNFRWKLETILQGRKLRDCVSCDNANLNFNSKKDLAEYQINGICKTCKILFETKYVHLYEW